MAWTRQGWKPTNISFHYYKKDALHLFWKRPEPSTLDRSSPPGVFLWKGFLKKCIKFPGEHSSNFIEITVCQGCSPVNLLHIFITPFPKKNLWRAASDWTKSRCTDDKITHFAPIFYHIIFFQVFSSCRMHVFTINNIGTTLVNIIKSTISN